MKKKSRIKITPVLIALNILVIILITAFYTTRLIVYYLKENGHKDEDKPIILSEQIIKKQSFVDLTKGLVLDKDTNIYKYKGDVDDNYLLYSGILYRIIEIDKDGNIKAVSDKTVTAMYSGIEKGYKNSYVNKWLNKSDEKNSGIYEKTIYGSDENLTGSYLCNDKVDDLTKITCEENNNDIKITLLSLYDYASSLGKESFINNGEEFYLSTQNSDGDNYYISATGDVGLNTSTTKVYGVRPVITIKGDTVLLSGKGTLEKPYIIEKHVINNLSDVYVSSYISFSGNKYKVVKVDESSVRVVSVEAIKENDKLINKTFGGSTNAYSNTKNTIGYYLNNTFYNALENNDYIVKSKWYIGSQALNNLDYSAVYSDSFSGRVGMLGLGDLFINEVSNVLTITKGIESDMVIIVINKEGNFYGDLIATKYNVRPAFNLKSDLEIVSGDGTFDSPYELGVTNEE